MNRPLTIGLVSLLFGCTAPTRQGAEPEQSPPRSNLTSRQMPGITSLMEHTRARADGLKEREELRAHFREKGLRVCEEGEVGTTWREDCNTCRCELGYVRVCTKAHCHGYHKPD